VLSHPPQTCLAALRAGIPRCTQRSNRGSQAAARQPLAPPYYNVF